MSEYQIKPSIDTVPGFDSESTFALLTRAAQLLSNSTLVPPQYRATKEIKEYGKVVRIEDNPNAIANCVIALNIARRMRADELMVMQNLYVVEGRPSWSAQWVIAAVNTCGKFSPLRFEITDLGPKDAEYTVIEWVDGKKKQEKVKQRIQNLKCVAWATEKATGERVESPPVTMEMAVAEGWYGKNGSKWQTMPEVMLRYRSAAFFGKLYAPELLMGLPTAEELHDAPPEERIATGREIPTAQVPGLPAEAERAPKEARGSKKAEPEPPAKEEPPTPGFAEQFIARCEKEGLDKAAVLEVLKRNSVTEADSLERMTDKEASYIIKPKAFAHLVKLIKAPPAEKKGEEAP